MLTVPFPRLWADLTSTLLPRQVGSRVYIFHTTATLNLYLTLMYMLNDLQSLGDGSWTRAITWMRFDSLFLTNAKCNGKGPLLQEEAKRKSKLHNTAALYFISEWQHLVMAQTWISEHAVCLYVLLCIQEERRKDSKKAFLVRSGILALDSQEDEKVAVQKSKAWR